ncbi:hypothetical protein L7F22_006245 [Adiantum nelumboides]|nr:hypothetical protein [Adiantum nelumboides]
MGNCVGGSGSNEFVNPQTRAETNEGHHQVKADKGQQGHLEQHGPHSAAPLAAKSAPKALIGPVLNRPMEDVRNRYNLGKELGRGQFGVTHLCTDKTTGALFACKSIAKRKLANKDDIEDVRREVQIMHHLAGQRNVVEMKGAFEDKQTVHLVMELCGGGELFDRIIARGHYTEKAAAAACRTIVEVVHTCHALGVMHRDLKPENFLLLNKSEDSPLKATDFGLSVFFKQGNFFQIKSKT